MENTVNYHVHRFIHTLYMHSIPIENFRTREFNLCTSQSSFSMPLFKHSRAPYINILDVDCNCDAFCCTSHKSFSVVDFHQLRIILYVLRPTVSGSPRRDFVPSYSIHSFTHSLTRLLTHSVFHSYAHCTHSHFTSIENNDKRFCFIFLLFKLFERRKCFS